MKRLGRGKGLRVFSLHVAREGKALADLEKGMAGRGQAEPAGDTWPCLPGWAQPTHRRCSLPCALPW